MRLFVTSLLCLMATTTAMADCAALPSGTFTALRLGGSANATGTFGTATTSHPAGTLAYDSDLNAPVYCDGNNWLQLASAGGIGGGSGGGTPEKLAANQAALASVATCNTIKNAYDQGKYLYFRCGNIFYYPLAVSDHYDAFLYGYGLRLDFRVQAGNSSIAQAGSGAQTSVADSPVGALRMQCGHSTTSANGVSGPNANVGSGNSTSACGANVEVWAR